MKFEQLLMQRSEEQHKRLALEEEVKKLQVELEGEETVRTVLEHALNGSSSMPSHPRHSVPLPAPVKALVSELEMIEDEILGLERKVDELRLEMNEERAQVRELERRSQKQNKLQRSLLRDDQWRSMSRKYDVSRVGGESRRASDSRSLASSNRDMSELSRSRVGGAKFGKVKANELSEELIKCVIGIFVELKRTHVDKEGSSSTRKLTSLSSISSKGFGGKTPFSNAKSPTFVFNLNSHSKMDPYAILFPNLDCIMRDVGPYKNFLQLTTMSLDITRFRDCLTGIAKLRVLMSKLCDVDLTFLTYKQKLAFWINIYNACIMHAFLEHGLPSSGEKLLALMNKASLNVGGIVLNALAIEHFILRCPTESNNAPAYDKEMLLRHAHGLGYPEPNVTFALCRGTWSSPALRVYTAENVADEMERAKVEYLEASISVTSKRKVVVPKLLQWHMSDFADDLGSLVEWIYSQLARSGSLKRLLMECSDEEAKLPVNEMVEVQPYDSEFRYLLST